MLRGFCILFEGSKVWLLSLMVLAGLVYGHEGDSHERARFESGLNTPQVPWTHLDFKNDPENFQFAIVSDRTGGPRKGVFQDAMTKLNWLQPEFVMSVGDLIQGTSENAETNAAEWDEMLGWIGELEMPFFFLAGNHDIQAKSVEGRVSYETMRSQWEDRFGTTYYYYVYKGVLFLGLFSNDGTERYIGEEQVSYFRDVLKEHEDVRWTMVFLHHPLWDSKHDSNFDEIESMLEGRKYSVFAGHQHMYRHFERKDTNYYVLASTGGGSPMRGTKFGEFDHVTWVTMTDDGPTLANLRLDGILPHDVTSSDLAEYSMLLTMSADIEANVVLKESDSVESGVAYLTFRNKTPHPIRFKGSFYHNPYVHPSPGILKVALGAYERETVAVSLRSLVSFKSEDNVHLEFQGSIGFNEEDVPSLEMSGRQSIELKSKKIEIISQEAIEFSDPVGLQFAFAPDAGQVRYTFDGSEPTTDSALYEGTLEISENGELRARLFDANGVASETDSVTFQRIKHGKGLLCDYYEYGDNRALSYTLPNFSTMMPTLTKRVSKMDPKGDARRDESFGMVYRGFIDLPKTGEYTFHLTSDDGARLIIDGKMVVNDPDKHPAREVSGSVRLSRGKQSFEVQHFQHKQKTSIGLSYTLPSGKRMKVPVSSYSY